MGRVFESHSFDGGLAWDEPEHTSLQNPDSKLHAVRLKNGGLLMAHNDHPVTKTSFFHPVFSPAFQAFSSSSHAVPGPGREPGPAQHRGTRAPAPAP